MIVRIDAGPHGYKDDQAVRRRLIKATHPELFLLLLILLGNSKLLTPMNQSLLL